MKVTFVITGIGMGHVSREIAILNELRMKVKDLEVSIMGYRSSFNFFKDKFKTIKLRGHNFPETNFKVSLLRILLANLFYPFVYFWDFYKIKKHLREFNPDFVISDAEPLAVNAARKYGKKVFFIYNVDLNVWDAFHYDKKFSFPLFIQSTGFFKIIAETYKKSTLVFIPGIKDKKVVKNIIPINPIIRKQKVSLSDEKTLMRKFNLKKKPILISLGGSTFGKDIIDSFLKFAKEFDEEFLVFGYHKECQIDNVTLFKFKGEFLEYLKACKGIILLCGHSSLMEALVYKKPTLAFPIRNYIEHYLNIYEYGDLIMAKKLNKKEFLKVHITNFINSIPKMEKKLERLHIRGNGAEQIVENILKRV
jgi:UDP-N-acetylglucosamine--N-acetylmuramyl-(pentapeptide) pyrophosphoryl-undecaprenol N-acetylglucosamine transferase